MAEALRAGVVVVGGGPAGIAAAVAAGSSGASVLLLDSAATPGGQVWRHRGTPPLTARRWLARLARSGATRVRGMTVVDAPAPGLLLAEREGRAQHVAYERLVLATGARELFLPFPGWTLPGVVGAGAAHALLAAGARFAGKRVVVAGSGPLLLVVAAALARDGARVAAVVEQARASDLRGLALPLTSRPGKLLQGAAARLRLLGVPYLTGCWVREASGDGRVARCVATDGSRERVLDCEILACGYGLVPNLELPRLLGCAVDRGTVVVDDSQRTSVPDVFAAGELVGVGGASQALSTGTAAGLSAAGRVAPPKLRRRVERDRRFADALARAFAPRAELRDLPAPGTLVCRCEDVALGRLDPAWGARTAKLVTRAGMGPCQGRVCGPALSFLFGWEPDSVRPPLSPVPISVLEEDA
ncbi:MAG: NAD(P)/FAD-dependent oxidoreductase [Acidobacteria bacterium]|nr:MAG: NAD(P)/FAD-dependent oxidoreductase [Acidobacteriota bacterium]